MRYILDYNGYSVLDEFFSHNMEFEYYKWVLMPIAFVVLVVGGYSYLKILMDKNKRENAISKVRKYLTIDEVVRIKTILTNDERYRSLVKRLGTNKKESRLIDFIMMDGDDAYDELYDFSHRDNPDDVLAAMRRREREILPSNLYRKLNMCRIELDDDFVR